MTLIRQEPAVLIGLLISILTVVGQVLSGGLTWAAAVPVIVGIITRMFVTPVANTPITPAPTPTPTPPEAS